MANRIAIII